MKKATIVFLSLLLLCLLGIKPLNDYILKEKDQVQITEYVVEGDSTMIEGVQIMIPARWQGHQYWDITYVAGVEPTVNTDYRFYSSWNTENWRKEEAYPGIYFMGYSGFIWDEDFPVSKQNEKLANVTDSVQLEESKEQTLDSLKLSDYVEYYPLMTVFRIPAAPDRKAMLAHMDDEEQWQVAAVLEQFFRIPVLEEELMSTLHLREKNGEVYVSGHSSARSNVFSWRESAVCGENAIYFTFRPYTNFGDLVDTSLIPGGYGIYKLPYSVDGENYADVAAEKLEMIYAINPEEMESECYLELDGHGNLLLFYKVKDGMRFVVLDTETGEEKQKFLFESIEDDMDFQLLTTEDDFFVYAYGAYDYFVVDWNEDRGYEERISFTVGEKDPLLSRTVNNGFDWDGKRLVFVSYTEYTEDYAYVNLCDFKVTVYDETGRIYYGTYENSLHAREEAKVHAENSCMPHNYATIEVTWPSEK